MIKGLLLRFFISAIALTATVYTVPGLLFFGNVFDFLTIVCVFFVVNFITKPVTRILFLPLEIATLGLVSIVLNTVTLLFLPRFITTIKVTSFWFSGLSGSSFVIAPIEIPAIATAVLAACIIGIISTLVYWLIK